MQELVEKILKGDIRATARALRFVDERSPLSIELLKTLYRHTGRALVVGITGTPGAGKSTLVDKLISLYRAQNQKVGVLAVDPTSPFSGGSILGDRIRMQRHFLDENVFIRSIATRGAMGGLSRTTWDQIHVLDAFGCNTILIETVGVGQDEFDIARTAHTTVVVMTPGGGDEIQASKAGILEIADVFVVNKADREGADAQVRYLESMIAVGKETKKNSSTHLSLSHHHSHDWRVASEPSLANADEWVPPILKTIAAKEEGLQALYHAIEAHRLFLKTPIGQCRKTEQMYSRLQIMFRDTLIETAMQAMNQNLNFAVEQVVSGQCDPYTACEQLLAKTSFALASDLQSIAQSSQDVAK